MTGHPVCPERLFPAVVFLLRGVVVAMVFAGVMIPFGLLRAAGAYEGDHGAVIALLVLVTLVALSWLPAWFFNGKLDEIEDRRWSARVDAGGDRGLGPGARPRPLAAQRTDAMIRTVMIGTISAQGVLVDQRGDIGTVDIGGSIVTGYLVAGDDYAQDLPLAA